MLHERENENGAFVGHRTENIRTRNSFLNIYYITNKWNKKINK